jgi:hypothetical protein
VTEWLARGPDEIESMASAKTASDPRQGGRGVQKATLERVADFLV